MSDEQATQAIEWKAASKEEIEQVLGTDGFAFDHAKDGHITRMYTDAFGGDVNGTPVRFTAHEGTIRVQLPSHFQLAPAFDPAAEVPTELSGDDAQEDDEEDEEGAAAATQSISDETRAMRLAGHKASEWREYYEKRGAPGDAEAVLLSYELEAPVDARGPVADQEPIKP